MLVTGPPEPLPPPPPQAARAAAATRAVAVASAVLPSRAPRRAMSGPLVDLTVDTYRSRARRNRYDRSPRSGGGEGGSSSGQARGDELYEIGGRLLAAVEQLEQDLHRPPRHIARFERDVGDSRRDGLGGGVG